MVLYLVKGFIGYAATSLDDAKALLAALADPSTAANVSTIDRVTAKLEALVQSDSGEPLTVSSIDDVYGTISDWVGNTSITLAVGLGDPDPNSASSYASTVSFSISGSTRVGTLALNTNALAGRLLRELGSPAGRRGAVSLALHLRLSSGETVGIVSLRVQPGVLASSPDDSSAISYLSTSAARAGFLINLSGVTSLTGGGSQTLDGQDAGGVNFPVGCIVVTSDSVSSVGFRLWRLVSGTLSATDLANLKVKPLNYSAAAPMYWQG